MVLALALAACGGPATTTTPPSTTTTTIPPTTTTTVATVPSPINGLPLEPEAADRRALVVKIDNHPAARPQSGLNAADAVIELPVEGITRLAAVFHTADSAAVGPVRSVRPGDWQIAALLDAPLIVSGGQGWVIAMNRDGGASIIEEMGPPYTFRSSERARPHNLYADTTAMRELADERGIPDQSPSSIWVFGEMPDGGEGATEITARFESGFVVSWTWTGTTYGRSISGVAQESVGADGVSSPIAVDVLVFLTTDSQTVRPPAGGGGPAKAVSSIGEGDAVVMAGGVAMRGHWQRPTADDPFTLTTTDGNPLLVPPGKPWISFLPRSGSVTW